MNMLHWKVASFIRDTYNLIIQGESVSLTLNVSRPTYPLALTLALSPEETTLVIALLNKFIEGGRV